MEQSSVKSKRQFWRRRTTPRPWWPWGIAPLAALGLLFLVGALLIAPRIEAEVREQVAGQIDAAGLPAIQVRGDGQGVTIITQAQAAEEKTIKALAATTRCDTWAGDLACPTSVDIRRVDLEAAPAILEDRPHAFSVERLEYGVRLTGEVPNLEEHDRILGIAGQHFDDISNALSISNESAGANYGRAVDQALTIASELESGKASWSGENLSVNGSAKAGAVAVMREQFTAIGGESLRGGFDVRSLRDGQQCNSDFKQILGDVSIRFLTGSASIDADSDELLDRLAGVAHSCPGTLSIQGHTDSRGDAEGNRALSQARAVAVREALVAHDIAADRITTEGFGESRPIADNGTSAGRAKNRRITITVIETN